MRRRRTDARSDTDREDTDARPVAEHVRLRAEDPELQRKIKLRRRALVLGLGAICLSGTVVAFFGEGGYRDIRRLHGEIADLETEIARRQAEIRRLEDAVLRLDKDPMARERVAREELGLLRPGEIDFLLPKEETGMWDAGRNGGGGRP